MTIPAQIIFPAPVLSTELRQLYRHEKILHYNIQGWRGNTTALDETIDSINLREN